MRRLERLLALVILLLTMVLGVINAETKTMTDTLVDKDFSDYTGYEMNYQKFPEGSQRWAPGSGNYLTDRPILFLAPYIGMDIDNYGYFEFGDSYYSSISDNWTLEFDMEVLISGPAAAYPGSLFAVIGSNSNVDNATGEDINAYMTVIETDEIVENMGTYYNVSVGDIATGEKVKPRNYLHIKMVCTDANTSTAQLKIIITSPDDVTEINKTVDGVAIGKPCGIYVFVPYSVVKAAAGPKGFLFDNFILTTDKTFEVVKCAEPEFAVTGVDGTARKVTISCATAGAEIYYSTSALNVGDAGWTAYTGEISTTAKTLYAYAVDPVYADTSDVVSFPTQAGTRVRLAEPKIIGLSYDAQRGYRFTIDPNIDANVIVPPSYTLQYSVNGNKNGDPGDYIEYNVGDTLYIPEGGVVYAEISADGYRTTTVNWATETYPNLNVIWSEDIKGKLESAGVGSEQLSLTLSNEKSYEEWYKSFYSIANVGTTSISIDSRLTLTTDSVFFMKRTEGQNSGLLSLKHNVSSLDSSVGELTDEQIAAEEEANYSRYEGMGIKGLLDGQYVFVRTNGIQPEQISNNAAFVSGVSTKYEYVYRVNNDGNLYLSLPYGTYVTSVEVRTDREIITTNEYGYATYITNKALDFSDMPSDFEALVVSEEPTSANFVYTPVKDVPEGEALIIKGSPNTDYAVPMGSAIEHPVNLLTYSSSSTDISGVEKPVYIVDVTTGNMIKVADKTQPIAAYTPYILSSVDETIYRHYTMPASGRLSIYSEKPLDFNGIEGLKAYVLNSETPDGVTLVEVSELPANYGVILEGTPGVTYDVPEVPSATINHDNFLIGSETQPFNTSSVANAVYRLNDEGEMAIIDKTAVTEIPAGEAYYVSKYAGFEVVRTNAAGATTHISQNALDFTDIVLRAFIASAEVNSDSITLSPVSAVPAGTAFLIKNGEANKEYKIPYKNGDVTIGTNLFTGSLTDDFNVSEETHYVYALLENGSELKHVDPSATITHGTAYIISQYTIPPVVETVAIEIPSTGMRSFVTNKALDFNGLDALEVLICDTVTMDGPEYERVYEVPAGTAFFVKGDAGVTYNVPVGTCESLPYVNLIKGSNITGFTPSVNNVYTYVYIVEDGEVVIANNITQIPRGEGYIISPWMGYEEVTMAASGMTTYVSKNPLDFSYFTNRELIAYVVDDETINSIHQVVVSKVPEKTPIILKGSPNTTYRVPVCQNATLYAKNLLRGSWDSSFAVSSTDSIVYIVSGGEFKIAAKTKVMNPGKAYFVSKYRGFEKVTTSESGYTTYVCEHDLDLSDIYNDVAAYIVMREKPTGFISQRVVYLPAGAPFYIKGKANTTYSLPYANLDVEGYETGVNIMRGSRTDSFAVSSVGDSIVYILSDGDWHPAVKTKVMDPCKAYIVSKYLGSEKITTSASGMTSYVCEHALDISDYDGEVEILLVDDENESQFHTQSVTQVPAGTPFFFRGAEEKDSTYILPWGDCTELPCENLARGSLTESFDCGSPELGDSVVYILSDGEFKKASKTKIMEPRKAYLVSKYLSSGSGAKRMTFNDDEEYITAIDDVEDKQPVKRVERRVNLAGQQVDDSYKGIVIDEKGRKYLQK